MSSFFNMDNPAMRFLSRICDLMILNLLCIVFCLPVITAGASVTALYSVTLKMAKNEEAYIVKGFLKAFKENFKQSTIIWLIMAFAGIVMCVDYQAATLLPEKLISVFRIFIFIFAFIYVMIFTYIFPYTARFENTLKNIFKNSLLIAILNLPWTILLIVYPLILVFFTFLAPFTLVYGSMLWIFFGFAVVAYWNSLIFRKVFVKYEPKEEEPSDTFTLLEDDFEDENIEK